MMKPKQILSVLIIAILISMLISCEKSLNDLEVYVNKVKSETTVTIKPSIKALKISNYTYPDNKKNPFMNQSIITLSKIINIAANKSTSLQFLERFSLMDLKFIGTIQKGKILWALLKTKNSIIHQVKVGNYIGQYHGKIISVSATKILLQEIKITAEGGWHLKTTSLLLEKW